MNKTKSEDKLREKCSSRSYLKTLTSQQQQDCSSNCKTKLCKTLRFFSFFIVTFRYIGGFAICEIDGLPPRNKLSCALMQQLWMTSKEHPSELPLPEVVNGWTEVNESCKPMVYIILFSSCCCY